MAITQYLAMTAAEMAIAPLPQHTAWMACHFSPYSTGLTNMPGKLHQGSLLILNDRTPIHCHDPERVCLELNTLLNQFRCMGLLVDFQNPVCPEAQALAAYLGSHLDFPMGISPNYPVENAAVFLPPVPTDVAVENYLQQWAGREIWLEAALEGQNITLTPEGAVYAPNRCQAFDIIHEEISLHCHYAIKEAPEGITFHTWRTPEDLNALLEEAGNLGVQCSVGLYQELGTSPP